MANTPIIVSVVAILLAAASLGYANLAVSQEASQLRSHLNTITKDIATVDADLKQLRGSLQTALQEARKQVSEREGLLQQITPFDPNLVAAALKEGTLTIYSVREQQDMVKLAQEFQKKFPGIKVDFYTAQSPELLSRVSSESKLAQSIWDVYDNDGATLASAVEIGVAQPYESKQYTKDLFPIKDPTNRMFFYGATVPVAIYNPNLVKKSDIQGITRWEQLPGLAAKYQGKILLDHPARAGPFTHVLGELKVNWNDDAKWTKFLNDLRALDARMFRSTGQIGRLVISEEGSIGINGLLHDVLQARERAAPLEFIPITPVVVLPSGFIISKNAPHPNAAKLLIEFMLSPDGQEIYSRAYRSPMRLGFVAKSSLSILFPNISPDQILGSSNPETLTKPQEFAKKYLEPIFGPA
ncbi:MAG: extracellular solute-binding protein [Thaumarchaeota archaeon]|nr:extracellular solute-binding protein [Nitrososphaerota archaeon]